MPSHATAAHNSEIRRRQADGEHITAADHSEYGAVAPIDNPASPAEFPLTAERYAPKIPEFRPRTEEEAARYAAESEGRHAASDSTQDGETADGDEEEEEEELPDGDKEEEETV